jgi:hypothetical protein
MGRRSRHLNPKHLGAIQSVDSRFITGISNGAGVGTWSDRAGSLDYSQGTSGEQPTYTTNSINGQPSVNFDGSNDKLRCTDTLLNANFALFTIAKVNSGDAHIAGARESSGAINSQTFRLLNIYGANGRSYMYGGSTNGQTYEFYSAGALSSMSGWNSYSVTVLGSNETDFVFRQNGNAQATTRTSTYGSAFPVFRIGMLGALQFSGALHSHGNMGLGAFTVFSSGSISNSLRKRMEHHLALSFKLPCA